MISRQKVILSEVMIVDDNKIIDLYFVRNENAIKQTKAKYGRLLFGVSYGILHSVPDAEECINDTYMKVWNSIPPQRPSYFSAFLTKIARNLSLNRYWQNKRRYGTVAAEAIFDEIAECIPAPASDVAEDIDIRDCLNRFLSGLGNKSRVVFVKRYFFMRSIREISDETGMSESAVKVTLSRLRVLLKERLEREGIYL
jgi:RNA polymerase sigma-70 factor (ECF subfamily)